MHKIRKNMESRRNGEECEWSADSSGKTKETHGCGAECGEGSGRESSWERCDGEEIGSKEECVESEGGDGNADGDSGGVRIDGVVSRVNSRVNSMVDEGVVSRVNSTANSRVNRDCMKEVSLEMVNGMIVNEEVTKEKIINEEVMKEENENMNNTRKEEKNKNEEKENEETTNKEEEETEKEDIGMSNGCKDEISVFNYEDGEDSNDHENRENSNHENSSNDHSNTNSSTRGNDTYNSNDHSNDHENKNVNSFNSTNSLCVQKCTIIDKNTHFTSGATGTGDMRSKQSVNTHDYSCYGNCGGNDGKGNDEGKSRNDEGECRNESRNDEGECRNESRNDEEENKNERKDCINDGIKETSDCINDGIKETSDGIKTTDKIKTSNKRNDEIKELNKRNDEIKPPDKRNKQYAFINTAERFVKYGHDQRPSLTGSINEQRYLMWCEIAIVYDMIGNAKMYKHAIENALKIRSGVEALVIYSRSTGVQPGQGTGTNYINAFVKEHRRTGLSVLLECYALLCDDQIRKFERRYGELTECGRVLENEVQRIESTGCSACVGQHSCACQDIINSERPSSYVHGSARMSGKDAFVSNESIDFFSDAYGAKTGRATIRDLKDKRYEEIRALEMNGVLCAESSADREEAELRDDTANITMIKKGNDVKDRNDEDDEDGDEDVKDVKDRVSDCVKDHSNVKDSTKDHSGVKDHSDVKDNVNCINNFKTHGRDDRENTNKQNVAERTNTPAIASARNFYALNKHFYLFYLSLVTAYHQRINRLHLSYNDILRYLSHSYRQTERSLMLFRLALILKQRKDYKSAARVLNVLSILAERTHCAVSVLDVHAQLAHLHFVQGATTECRKLLNAILHVDHHHLFSTVLKMECLYTTDMVACIRYCSRMAGRCVQGEYFLLRCYFSLGMIEQCFDVYTNRERSREYSAECGRTHSSPEIDKYFANTIGIVYFNLKDVSSSMAAFKRALSIDSDFKEARYNLALVQNIANSLSTNDFNVYAFNKTKFKEVMLSVSDPIFLPPYFFINCINK